MHNIKRQLKLASYINQMKNVCLFLSMMSRSFRNIPACSRLRLNAVTRKKLTLSQLETELLLKGNDLVISLSVSYSLQLLLSRHSLQIRTFTRSPVVHF